MTSPRCPAAATEAREKVRGIRGAKTHPDRYGRGASLARFFSDP